MFEPTLPNLLTVFRILLVPVLVAALLQESPGGDYIAAGVFALASATDILDGYIARRRKIESTFGKLMDPLADKLLVTAALVALVSLGRLEAWVAMVIISREFAVTGLRQLAIDRGIVLPASGWGKRKTMVQVIMVLVLITVDGSPLWTDLIVYAAVAITIFSGADYFWGLRRMLAEGREEEGASRGVPTGAVPSAGVPSAGVPSAGVPSAGMPSAGMPSAGVPPPGPVTAE